MNRLINMVINQLMRLVMSKGMSYLSQRGAKPKAEMTTEERAQAARAAEMSKKARDLTKLRRKL